MHLLKQLFKKKGDTRSETAGDLFRKGRDEQSAGRSFNTPHLIKACQSGSIMLEVVAVLALMGVMGAMLFRQIYQRNQELHNIQMASEIRTVKEAFSAYIKSNLAALQSQCQTLGIRATGVCGIDSNTLGNEVIRYLPEGWFGETDSHTLNDAYTFQVYSYIDASDRQEVYGLVVPTAETLPQSGWNFKRAARVALLVGADGGAYDSSITGSKIAGSLGSWEIPSEGVSLPVSPVYAAITGIDVFAPEYVPPEGTVNLPSEWSLALRDLHAYETFSVGNAVGGTGCYGVNAANLPHTGTNGNPQKVNSDNVPSGNGFLSNDCQPLFWVEEGTTGVVRVATDLHIGEVEENNGVYSHNDALTLTKEGAIKQKDGVTIGPGGQIIAKERVQTALGDLQQNEQYMIDPGYTSTMNDIRLTSRGGVRLSEILPNYILKDQKTIGCTISKNTSSCSSDDELNGTAVRKPADCPTGYKVGLVIIPTRFGTEHFGNTATISGTTTSVNGEGNHAHGFSDANVTITKRQFQVWVDEIGDLPRKDTKPNSGSEFWVVKFGYSSDVDSNELISAIAQTYCVFDPSVYNNHANECIAAGFTCSPSPDNCTTCKSTRKSEAFENEQRCKEAGLTWSNDRCVGIYVTNPTTINNYGNGINKEKACKNAVLTWNGTTCTN